MTENIFGGLNMGKPVRCILYDNDFTSIIDIYFYETFSTLDVI